MSHGILELDRPMYGSAKAAWHGLGTVVAGQPTSADAIRLARLDWNVQLESVLADAGDGSTFEVDGAYLNCRTDLGKADPRRVLGVVRSRYNPIQNAHAFGIADALSGEGGARFETAGSLRNGRIVWLLAKLPDAAKVVGESIDKYLLLKTTHDGSGCLEILFTPVRVVCQNTLALALRDQKRSVEPRFAVRHTDNATRRIDEARRVLGLADAYFDKQTELMEYLASSPLNPDQAKAVLNTLVPDPAAGVSKTRAINTRHDIARLYVGAQPNGRAITGTRYGMLQAVADYADHSATVRTTAQVASRNDARMESALWGSGAALKQRALDTLLDSIDLSAAPADPVDSLLSQIDLN